MRRSSILAVLLALILPAFSQAQQRFGTTSGGGTVGGSTFGGSSGTTGSSGMFGSRSLGGSLSPGNRAFAGGGTAVGGGGALRPGQTLQGDAGAGQVQGNERFTRQGRQPGNFVGADTADLPSFLTELATGGFNSGLQQQRNRGQQGQRQGQNANQQAGRTSMGRAGQQRVNYRIARSVGFEYTLPPPAQLQTQLGARLQALPGVKALGPIEVTLQQRTAVLRGSVATAHDRDLAERLALLEAGVDQVQNELTIAPPPAAPTPAAAAAGN